MSTDEIFKYENETRKRSHKMHHNGKHKDMELTSQPLLEPDRKKPEPPLADEDGIAAGDESHVVDGKNGDSHTEDDRIALMAVKVEVETESRSSFPLGSAASVKNLPDRCVSNARDDADVIQKPQVTNVTSYQQRKNLAQGMMDLALLAANANQLRYVLEAASYHPYFYTSIIFISLSLAFQFAVGIGLIMNTQYDVHNPDEVRQAEVINDLTLLGIFLIIIINVFIAVFSGGSAAPTTLPATIPTRIDKYNLSMVQGRTF